MKDSGAFEKIQKYVADGGIVYGGSAGSIIFGKDINVCSYMDANEVNLKDTSGFNSLFGFSFTAHYTNKSKEKHTIATESLTQYSNQEPVIALPEEDSLYTDGTVVKIVGTRPWYVFNKGNRTMFNPGIEYTKDNFIKLVMNNQPVLNKDCDTYNQY